MNKYIKILLLIVVLINANEPIIPNNNSSDESLRLMYKVFTFSSDLENAYKIAKKGVKKYPELLFWHQELAKVSQWLDKKPEAIEQMIYIHSKTKDKKLSEDILSYALASYQYEVALPILKEKVLSNPSAKNIKNILFIYNKIGTPEASAEILEELSKREGSNKSWLPMAMGIYIELGELEKVAKFAEKIEEREILDFNTSAKLYSYYLSQKNLKKAYNTLLRTNINKKDNNNTKFYQQVSDLGWYLQDIEHSAKASKKLFNIGKARLIDIERIIYYFGDLDKDLTQRATLYGSKEFNSKYLYSSYINSLYNEKRYRELSIEFDNIESGITDCELKEDSYFWLMKANTYGALGELNRAIKSFEEALRLENNSPNILSTIMWFYIDHKEVNRLKKMIFEIEESSEIAQVLWLPLAVANFSLQKPDRAMAYIKKLISTKDKNIDIKLMYAYILQAREETNAFMQIMREVYILLNHKLEKNQDLIRDEKFLEQYLSVGSYFMNVDKYESLLLKSKSSLDEKKYIELSIFWSLRHNSHARAKYLASKLSNIEPWMKLNIAINNEDRTKQLDLLYRYHSILPIRDRVMTAISVGSVSLAQTLSFDGLEENKYDYLLYKQSIELIERYTDKLTIDTGYHRRGSIDRSYLDIKNRYYISRAWSFLTNVYLTKDKNIDPKNLTNIPKNDNSLNIGLKKEFDSATFEFLLGFRSSVENYLTFSTKLHYMLMSRVNIDLEYYNSSNAEETTYLLLGGKKDGAKAKISLQYLPSSNISISLIYDKFYSQDDYYLGDGYYSRLEWYRQIRNGYPDISVGLFADYGNYNDNYAEIGVLKDLMPYKGKILPETFYNIGANLFYGSINKSHYTRVWRPYAEISPYYNGYAKKFNFSLGGGYGGSLYGRDHLSIGFNYDQSINGTQESNFKLYLNYLIFY